MGVYIYAVPVSVVESWPAGSLPPRDWFDRPDNPDCKRVGTVWKGRVGFDDNRLAIEVACRLSHTGDGMRLVQLSVNEGSGWYRSAAHFGCCCGIPIGTAGLGVWLVGRLFRRVR